MGIPKGPTEGGSGGKRGHSNMEHWGYTDEVKHAARKRRRVDDKRITEQEQQDLDDDSSGQSQDKSDSIGSHPAG